MDLYKDILARVFEKQEIRIEFVNLKIDNSNDIVESVCYNTIQNIKEILDNEKYNDFECIERIVTLLESIGTTGGIRHDFG